MLTVAEAAAAEPLTALPDAAFPAELTVERVVSANALVSVWGNRYSVPPELASTTVQVMHRCGTDSTEIRSDTPPGAAGRAPHDLPERAHTGPASRGARSV